MVESDHNDEGDAVSGETSCKDNPSKKSESSSKRFHEDCSEDDKSETPSKKLCIRAKERSASPNTDKNAAVLEANGAVESSEEGMNIDKTDDEQESPDKSVESEKLNDITTETDESQVEDSKLEKEEDLQKSLSEHETESKDNDEEKQEDNEESENKEEQVETDQKKLDVSSEEQSEEEKSVGDKKEESSAINRSNDSEVVDGLELSVECASDKEVSSSESDKSNDKGSTPRPKTIIVKAKPNDSELDASTSEAEKSNIEEKGVDEEAETKKVTRKGKAKLDKKVQKSSESEENSNISNDEDYSPRTKKKFKKQSTPKKVVPKLSESKKGKGRVTKRVSKTSDNEDSKSESENDEMSLADRAKKTMSKNKEKVSKNKSESDDKEDSDSDNVSDHNKNTRNGRKSKNNVENKTIQNYKRYIHAAGIAVKSYEKIFAGCRTNAARVACLKELLEDHGVHGRPTLEKCKKAKRKMEKLKEIAELDTSNIISEGRVTRARKGADTNKVSPPVTPIRTREMRNTFKRIQNLVDSDTE